MFNNPFEHFSGCFSNKCLTVLCVHIFYFILKKQCFLSGSLNNSSKRCIVSQLWRELHVKNTDVAISVHDHLCSAWSLWTCFFYCNFHYTVTKYWDVGYDHLHAVWGLKYCSCCHYVLIYYWLKMSRDSHVSGVEPMRAETLFQTTAVQSS